MKKKYQVFVSSTYTDLIEERRIVMQSLLELDCIPVGMELFPAADEDQWTLIKRLIDDCDYYLVIIGGRYGSLNKDDIGYTQLEYEYALEKGIPIIGFIHKNPGSIPLDKSETSPMLIKKLQDFKNLVQQKLVRFWENPSDLESKISRSLVKLIEQKPRSGWVKGTTNEDTVSNATNEQDLMNEINNLKSQLELEKKRFEELAQKAESQKETEMVRNKYYEEFRERKRDEKA